MKSILFAGWSVFVLSGTFVIWLGQGGHSSFVAAADLPTNHRIRRQDLLPTPPADCRLVGRYVRTSGIGKFFPVWIQDLAPYPRIEAAKGEVPILLKLESAAMADAVNRGTVIDVFTGPTLLFEKNVLAVVCKDQDKDCTAAVSATPTEIADIEKAKSNTQIFIRSY